MAFWSVLFCVVTLVSASSYPDHTSCFVEDPTLNVSMHWVIPAVRTDAYTLRTGDGCDVDPTSYIPGQFMSIHLRTHRYKGQFRGLLIYATDSQNNRVGDWELDWPNSNMFWKPAGSCLGKSLMHLNGAEKYYHHEFKFVTPPANTGTITFHALVKRGQANTGEFYWPNLNGNLVLTEVLTPPVTTTWIEGEGGSTCTTTCTNVGKSCDATLLSNAYKWAGALQKDVIMSVGCASPALASDSATSIFKDRNGWCTYPSPLVGQFADACNVVPPANTVPLCPCGTTGVPSFGPTAPPPSTDCLNSFVFLSSAPKSSSNMLSMFLVLLTGLFLNQQRQASFALTLVCVLFCAYTVQAHNWVYSVSRSFNQASTYKPCRPRVTDVPHWQINQGKEFTMEWATGHDHYFYFTVVHADDINELENTTQNHLDDYLSKCLDSADYMIGKGSSPGSRWAKQHINSRIDPGKMGQDSATGASIYERNVTYLDPVYIPRHKKFGPYDNEIRWVYKTQYTSKDKRCSYFSPAYPHLVAVHRFVQVETIDSRAGDRDTARFTIELSQGAIDRHGYGGQYLVQYLWRGYFDCADVDLFPDSQIVTEIGGRPLRKDEPQWNKVDHCQFEEIQGLETSCTEVITSAERCLQSCIRNVNCGGINVVPMWLPKTVYPLFSNRVGIPWDDMYNRCDQSKFADVGRGGKVCYGVNPRFANNTHASYSVTDDPEDPLFYATCFVKRAQWAFDLSLGNSTGTAIVPVPPAWAYGSKCVDCMEWKASQENFNIPSWKLPDNCVNCETATLPPVPALPGTLISKGFKCDGGYNGQTNWDYQKVSPTCANKRCVKTLYMVNSNNGDIKADECIAKAKADPACSEFVQHKGNNPLKTDSCECFLKDPCCGSCVPVDANFGNWEWNIYTTKTQAGDAKCERGIKSPDNTYCCSATCKDENGNGVCMPVPGLQISFQPASMNAPDGWAVDNGAMYGPRNNLGMNLSTQWGWNCDLNSAAKDRSGDDGTDYHSTMVEASNDICGSTPEWKVGLPNGFYQVDTLYTRQYSNMRGCKIQGLPNVNNDHLGTSYSDIDWVSRVVNTTNGVVTLSGGFNSQCPGYAAVVIYPKAAGDSSAYCQNLPGMCCPLFIDMANRPCSRFDAPCRLV